VNPVEIRPFLVRERRRQKIKVAAPLEDTKIKVALEAEVEETLQPVEYNRSLSNSQ
jgi:hypothetical protein